MPFEQKSMGQLKRAYQKSSGEVILDFHFARLLIEEEVWNEILADLNSEESATVRA